MRMGWILAYAMLCGVSPALHAQEPSARAWVDSTTFRIGDPITVHVEVEQAPSRINPLVNDTLGVFTVLEKDGFRGRSGTVNGTLTVAVYDSGTAVLPSIELGYVHAGDSSVHVVRTNPLVLTIRLVEVDTAGTFKDIKPVVDIPLTVGEISLIIGSIIGLVLLGMFVYTTVKRRTSEAPVEAYVPLLKPAHVLALEELAVLKEKRLWQQGLIKPYYSEVTEILRRYFEYRFGFMALEQTTDEILVALGRFERGDAVLGKTETMLRRADLVKFAKHQPAIPEHEEMLTLTYDIIEMTKVRPDTEAAQKQHAEGVNV